MALACNIQRKGRVLRGIIGGLLTAAGIAAAIALWPPEWWGWLIAVLLIGAGLFSIVEATIGWCAVRALGYRTPW